MQFPKKLDLLETLDNGYVKNVAQCTNFEVMPLVIVNYLHIMVYLSTKAVLIKNK